MEKKLYKSKYDRKIQGVCGGLAKYLNMDSTIIRVVWALLSCCAGTGLLLYIICALIVPDEPDIMQ